MNNNILNGGLVAMVENSFFVSDINYYKGTYIIDIHNKRSIFKDTIFWFMNLVGDVLVYSDQKLENKICSYNIHKDEKNVIINKPCYGLLSEGEWIYYINEDDRRIYRCLLNGKEQCIISEQVICFVLDNGKIYYSTEKGINTCDINGQGNSRLTDSTAINMIILDGMIFFSDKKNGYVLTKLRLENNTTDILPEIYSSGINSDGKFLYISNMKNENSIYRVDLDFQNCIRLYGNRADCLHIFDDYLVFNSNNTWLKMPLLGGNPLPLI